MHIHNKTGGKYLPRLSSSLQLVTWPSKCHTVTSIRIVPNLNLLCTQEIPCLFVLPCLVGYTHISEVLPFVILLPLRHLDPCPRPEPHSLVLPSALRCLLCSNHVLVHPPLCPLGIKIPPYASESEIQGSRDPGTSRELKHSELAGSSVEWWLLLSRTAGLRMRVTGSCGGWSHSHFLPDCLKLCISAMQRRAHI